MSELSHRVWFEIEGEGYDGVLLYKIFPGKGEARIVDCDEDSLKVMSLI